MVSAPEKEKLGTPLESRVENPADLEKLGEQERALEGYLEKVEREPQSEPITDEAGGQVVLTPSASQQVTITLPLSQEEVNMGLHHKIVEAIYWLSAWCVRIAKKAAVVGIRVVYRNAK